jgi:hypothetical protein
VSIFRKPLPSAITNLDVSKSNWWVLISIFIS